MTEGRDRAVCSPPRSLRELFWGFSLLSVQGFGGVMAVTQRELIDRRRWMPREEFLEDWAVSQVLPGPNITNLGVIIGDRFFGARGALVALVGLLLFPLIIVAVLALAFASFHHLPAVQGALKGMGLVVVSLILTTAIKLASALRTHVGGVAFCVIAGGSTFFAIAVLRFPLAWVLMAIGGVSCGWTYLRIIRAAAAAKDGA